MPTEHLSDGLQGYSFDDDGWGQLVGGNQIDTSNPVPSFGINGLRLLPL